MTGETADCFSLTAVPSVSSELTASKDNKYQDVVAHASKDKEFDRKTSNLPIQSEAVRGKWPQLKVDVN